MWFGAERPVVAQDCPVETDRCYQLRMAGRAFSTRFFGDPWPSRRVTLTMAARKMGV
jgi:hypothetical protein